MPNHSFNVSFLASKLFLSLHWHYLCGNQDLQLKIQDLKLMIQDLKLYFQDFLINIHLPLKEEKENTKIIQEYLEKMSTTTKNTTSGPYNCLSRASEWCDRAHNPSSRALYDTYQPLGPPTNA